MPEYEEVRRFSSKSKSEKLYTVKRNTGTGVLSCDCPVWVFNKNGDRTCYHTMRVLVEEGRSAGMHTRDEPSGSTKEPPRRRLSCLVTL